MNEEIPQERAETLRQTIIRLLDGRIMTASELSKEVGASEREIYDHLDHIKRSKILEIIPSECADCGFIFEERTRSKKPGKCPSCKSTRIYPPSFSIQLKE